jgi:hypothetical protein
MTAILEPLFKSRNLAAIDNFARASCHIVSLFLGQVDFTSHENLT